MAGQWKPLPDHTYLVNTAHTIIKGMPVVVSTTANTVDQPAGTAADKIVGVAQEDAGPNALGSGVNQKDIAVQVFGTAMMYGKAGITAGDMVKVGSTISVTPPGYSSTVTVYPVTTATQTTAGNQPYPVVGRATNSTTNDGDIVYVDLLPGATY